MSVDGVVLAAGRSTRAGTNKMLLDLDGQSLIAKCVAGLSGPCKRVIVVGGHRFDELKHALEGYPAIELVFNKLYDQGMYSSVREGLRHSTAERVFVTPGDCPLIGRRIYEEMLLMESDLAVPVYNGRTGHPVLMKRRVVQELLMDSHCGTLREFIRVKGYDPYSAPGPEVLVDLDTPEDYQSVLKGLLPW